jgi:hypothetical protein
MEPLLYCSLRDTTEEIRWVWHSQRRDSLVPYV